MKNIFWNRIKKNFFERRTDIVAKDILGKILVRKISNKFLKSMIVETEAYFGLSDPASRAKSYNSNFFKIMSGEVGKVLIYMVHNNWLFNIVAHSKNKVGAVLIRGVEPINKKDFKKVLKIKDLKNLFNGPGKLTKNLKIDKKFNLIDLTTSKEIFILNNKKEFKIYSSHRIGVKKDLNKKLRFYIKLC